MSHQATTAGAGTGTRRAPVEPVTEGPIDKMLAGSQAPAKTNRLDLTAVFSNLSSHANDCKNLGRVAELVMDELLRQKNPTGELEGYTKLVLGSEQIETYRWLVNKLVDAGAGVDQAVEDLEDMVSSQNVQLVETITGEAARG